MDRYPTAVSFSAAGIELEKGVLSLGTKHLLIVLLSGVPDVGFAKQQVISL